MPFCLRWKALSPLLGVVFAGAASAAGWDDGGGPAWQALLAKAKAEGPVVAAGCPELYASLSKAFKADTGLEISWIVGASPEVGARFRAEVESGRNTIDVRLSGAADLDEAKAGRFYPIRDLLSLPNVLNPDNWSDKHMIWSDNTQRYMPIPSQYVSTRPVINKDVLDPSKLRLLTDLLKPEFKGKIAAYDPTIVGAGQAAATYFATALGIDFVEKLYKDQQVTITTDLQQLGEWGARGLYPVILGIDPLVVNRFIDSGVKSLVFVTPEDAPGSVIGGCSVPEMPKNPPHLAAVTVFVNWYLSTSGQKALVEASHYPSMRVDVPPVGVPDYFVPNPKLTYVNQYNEDWYLNNRPVIRDKLKTILAR